MRCHVFLVAAFILVGSVHGKRKVDIDRRAESDDKGRQGMVVNRTMARVERVERVDTETCAMLTLALAIWTVTPIPLPFSESIPLLPVLVCCPDWLYAEVTEVVGKLGKSQYEQWLKVHGELSDADLTEMAEDEQRAMIMELYDDLTQLYRDNNAPSLGRRLALKFKDWTKWFRKKEHFETDYAASMKALSALRDQRPWVVYPHLASAFTDPALGYYEKVDMMHYMIRLKEKYPFLPLMADEKFPEELRQPEDLKIFEEVAKNNSGSSVKQLGKKVLASLKTGRDKVCDTIGLAAKKVSGAIQKAMTKLTDMELQELKDHVDVMSRKPIGDEKFDEAVVAEAASLRANRTAEEHRTPEAEAVQGWW